MSIQRILVLVLLLLTTATITLLITSNSDSPAPDSPSADTPPTASRVPPAPGENPASPPDQTVRPPVQSLPALPPPEAVVEEDDEQTEKEQVEAVLAQLGSSDPAQRIEAAEQLGAYPTKEAEVALQQALAGDSDPEVRNTAAQSLGYVEKPSDGTLNALFAALEDQNEEVRLSALSTLEDFLLGTEEGSKRYKKILAGLKGKAGSRSVPQDTREAIHDILEDQTAPAE